MPETMIKSIPNSTCFRPRVISLFIKQERNSLPFETIFSSAFKPPGPDFTPLKAITPLKPSRIISSNSSAKIDTADMYESTTRQSYLPLKTAKESIRNNLKHSIYHTHFKMDSDKSINSFNTSNQAEYPMRSTTTPSRNYNQLSILKLSKPGMLGMTSTSHQGNISEYVDVYKPQAHEGVDIAAERMKRKLNDDNIKVGGGSYCDKSKFTTTSMDDYRGHLARDNCSLSNTAVSQRKRVSSISFGDPNKIVTGSSNNAESYAIGGVSGMTTYDKREAQGATYGSSIKLGDSKVKHHHYLEYPHYHKPERRYPVDIDQNISSFPEGDLDRNRVRERLAKKPLLKPPPNSFPIHVKCANLRTHSSVHLGQSPFYLCYESTVKNSYQPIKMKVDHVGPPKGNIVFDYKSDKPICSSMCDSYNFKSLKDIEKLNQKALENLKKSHIKHPTDMISFVTTHKHDFNPHHSN